MPSSMQFGAFDRSGRHHISDCDRGAAVILRRVPAHVLAAALCLGLAAANLTRVHTLAFACAVAVSTGLLVVESAAARFAIFATLLCLLGWWWASARLDALDRSQMSTYVDRAGRAIVVVTTRPSVGRFDVRAQGRLQRFAGRPMNERVQLEFPRGRAPPEQGAMLDVLAVVNLPRPPAEGFDERTWLRRHGVHVVLHVDEWTAIGKRGGLGGLADAVRTRLERAIAPGLAGERRAVLQGIVLGNDEALSDELRRDFRASGLYHLLAVSGQNVVLVAAGVLVLAWLAGVNRWIGEVGALAGIGAYVLAVGAQPSVIRAGIAASLASLAWLTGRLRDAWYAFLVGAIALLAWNPYVLLDPGFQLSFAAVAAIFTLAPGLMRRLEGYPLPFFLRAAVAVSTACGLATAPIVWVQFGALPLLAVPANALAEPAIPILLGLAFLTAGLGMISPAAAAFVAWLNGWIAAYVAICARAIGSLPFAQVTSNRGLAGLAAAVLASTYAWHRWRRS